MMIVTREETRMSHYCLSFPMELGFGRKNAIQGQNTSLIRAKKSTVAQWRVYSSLGTYLLTKAEENA